MQKPMTFKTSKYGFKNVRNDGNKEKPWEAMYRSLVIRLDEIVQNNESINSMMEQFETRSVGIFLKYRVDSAPRRSWSGYF